MTSDPKLRPRRRWFRFSLRALLVFTVLAGSVMGWVAHERLQSHRELKIAEQLWARNVTVTLKGPLYDRAEDENQPSWWRTRADLIFGRRIWSVAVEDASFDDLTSLAELSNIRQLWLSGTRVSDLAPLAGLTSLEQLNLNFTRVQNLGPISQLQKLERLNLNGTPVNELSPLVGLTQLFSLDLTATQIDGLTKLAGLNSLRRAIHYRHKGYRQSSRITPKNLAQLPNHPMKNKLGQLNAEI